MRQKLKAGILLFLLAIIFTIPAYAEDTDAWINDWDYYIFSGSTSNPQIKITGYKGDSTEAHIYGRALVNGINYRIVVSPYESTNDGVTEYISPFNNTDGTDIEELYFHAVDGQGVYVSNGSSADGLFWGMPNLKKIHFGDGTDFSNIYDGRWMFFGDTSLTEADFENLDLSRMVRADHMFEGASALKKVIISYPVGSTFSSLFKDCSSLENVNVTTTSEHPDWLKCQEMFENCTSLTGITLTGFNTGASANPYTSMFRGCSDLESIDLSQLDLSAATDFSYMFSGCRSLTTLDFTQTSWNPAGANLTGIIEDCTSLSEISTNENIIVSDSTGEIGSIDEPKKVKVTGRMSDSFNENFFQKFRAANRYIEALDVRAEITLVGDETYDSLSYGLEITDMNGVRILDNDGSDAVCFNSYEHGLYIHQPGEYTITLTQGNRTDSGTVEAVSETDDGFSCSNPVLSKNIRVTRHDDGMIVIEEA